MEIFYICFLLLLILTAIIAQSSQTKKIVLSILLILFILSAIIQFARFGFNMGIEGVIGMCLPAGITAYFLNKVNKKS